LEKVSKVVNSQSNESEQVEEAVPLSPARMIRYEWLQTHISRLRNKAHHRFPNLVAFQSSASREYVEEKDQRDNAKSSVLPEDELRVRTLWGVEVYGPREIEDLYSSIKKLGWDSDSFPLVGRDPLKWIAEQRMYGFAGSFNIGPIFRKAQGTSFLRGRHASVPAAVDHMFGYIYQLTPSTTAVILGFVLTDEISTSYETVLNSTYSTVNHRKRGDRGYRILGVDHGKTENIEQLRTSLRSIVTDWFQSHLPGFFSLAVDGNRLPTAELITTSKSSLFPPTASDHKTLPAWIELMKSNGFRDVWNLKSLSGLSMAWSESEGENRFHSIIDLQTSSVTDEDLEFVGERNSNSYSYFVDERVRGVLVHFAVLAFVQDVVRSLRLTRESMATDASSHQQVLATVSQIKSFFDKTIGIPTMMAEIATKSKNDHTYKRYCDGFESERFGSIDSPREIAETLRLRTDHIVTYALAQEKETREHLGQVSAILSTEQSIKIQSRMEFLTVVAIVVAFASLVVSLWPSEGLGKIASDLLLRLSR
jgi:hypothetical protein